MDEHRDRFIDYAANLDQVDFKYGYIQKVKSTVNFRRKRRTQSISEKIKEENQDLTEEEANTNQILLNA